MKKIFLFLILLTQNVFADIDTHKKSTYFILQNSSTYKNSLSTIADKDKYSLILIVSESRKALLNETQKQVFDNIIVAKPFTYDVVHSIVQNVISERDLKHFDFLSHDEYSLPIVGKLRDSFNTGSPGFKELNRFLSKTEMKKILKNKIRIPHYVAFSPQQYSVKKDQYLEEITSKVHYPIFAKPVDAADATNTSKIESFDELKIWAENHKSDNNFELDEFIEGVLYHIDSLVYKDQIILSQVSRYAYPCYDFAHYGKPLGSIALPDNVTEVKALKEFNKKVLQAMQPVPNGATHLEVFLTPQKELVFVEIAARSPGGIVPKVYEKYLGIKFEELHLKLQMGQKPNIPNNNVRHYAAWIGYPTKQGIVKSLVVPPIKSQYELYWKIKEGDKLFDAVNIKDYALIMLLWNREYSTLEKDFKYLIEQFKPYELE